VLDRSVARREEFGVEVEERHHIDVAHAVQHGLCAHIHVGLWEHVAVARDRDDRTIGSSLQLFA
jgi:hypothetical protein